MTNPIRIIARLDIKGENLIKGIHLEGLRIIGCPRKFAREYYEDGVDELILMDAVASLYGRNSLSSLIKNTVSDVFVPITVGGGIRNENDVEMMLRSGADKIAINTAAIQNPKLIETLAKEFGSQCVVLSIESKFNSKVEIWEAYVDNGREKTGINVIEWARKGVDYGAGEILITSIDREGTRKGFDIDLISSIADVAEVPIIISGGMGVKEHLLEATRAAKIDAVAMADILHYKRESISEIKAFAKSNNLIVRGN